MPRTPRKSWLVARWLVRMHATAWRTKIAFFGRLGSLGLTPWCQLSAAPAESRLCSSLVVYAGDKGPSWLTGASSLTL